MHKTRTSLHEEQLPWQHLLMTQYRTLTDTRHNAPTSIYNTITLSVGRRSVSSRTAATTVKAYTPVFIDSNPPIYPLAHSSIMGATIFPMSFKQVRNKKGRYCSPPTPTWTRWINLDPIIITPSSHNIVSLKDGIHTWNVQSNNRRDVEIKNAFYELLILQQMILSSNSNTPPTLKTL